MPIPIPCQRQAKAAVATANTQIITCDTMIKSRCVAFGRQYVLYRSNVRMEDVAINSALRQEVHAMNRLISRATAPPFPAIAAAAAGAARPAETCEGLRGFG